MRAWYVTTIISLLLTPVLLLSVSFVRAQVMQSASYRIESDSVNVGGGFSSSTSFVLESTSGEVGTGDLASDSYNLYAGYQQMHEVYISLSAGASVSMSPSLSGLTGGTSNGSTTVTVVTDSGSGYSLTILASQSPAMQSGAQSISDYSPAGGADFTFTTPSATAHFGYSPSGADITTQFKDNGAACGAGSGDTLLACWNGLSTSPVTIAEGIGSNHPLGATTIVYFRVGIGGTALKAPGTYTATTTLTALPL